MARNRPKKRGSASPAGSVAAPVASKSESLAILWSGWLPKVLLIAAMTLWIYWPALWGGFIWDDNWYLTTNPEMRDLAGLWKIWFQPEAWIDYYPIKEMVQWIEWQLWSTDTFGYHLTNVILHVISSLLVWRLLGKFGLRLAWLGGLVFAVHPVQVDSVCLIVELKNTLSLPFFLLSLCHWIDYEEQGRSRDYRWSLGLFTAAMLCKVTMITFPAIILLYAWWKRGRIGWSDVKTSLPFAAVSVVMAVMTLTAYHGYSAGNAEPSVTSSGSAGVLNAGRILSFYFSRVFWPVDYLPLYPRWTVNPRSPAEYVPLIEVAVAIGWVWTKRRTWGRHALLGLGFFSLLLAPFLDLVQVNYMCFTWVMDHLLYLPIIGILGLVIAALGDIDARWPASRRWGRGVITVIVALMAIESHAFASLFVDDETLWRYTLLRFPDSWVAHLNLGSDLLGRQQYEEAIGHLALAQELNPADSEAYYDMGSALEKLGRTGAAREQYQRSLQLNPNNGNAYLNLGGLLLRTGDRKGAMAAYGQAVRIIPDFAELRYNLGSLLLQSGDLPAAVEQFKAAVQLDPGMLPARENYGNALARSGNLPAAIEQFEAAIRINSNDMTARKNLALALAQTGHIPEAIDQFQQILATDPGNAQVQEALAKLKQHATQPGQTPPQ